VPKTAPGEILVRVRAAPSGMVDHMIALSARPLAEATSVALEIAR